MSNVETCSCENDKYAGDIANDSFTTCNEITETIKSALIKTVSTKSIPTNFNEKRLVYKIKNLYILLVFVLITMMYQAKQKHRT